VTPAAALSVAKEFHHAFELCRGNGHTALDGRPNPDIPSVVNLAFAIELALKAILLSYGPSPRGHGLQELFQQLPESDRVFIRSSIPFEEGRFSAGLAAVSEAFVEWRYIHEQRGFKSISLEFLMHLWRASCELAEQKRLEQRKRLRKAASDA
jgi:hypothetical protein